VASEALVISQPWTDLLQRNLIYDRNWPSKKAKWRHPIRNRK